MNLYTFCPDTYYTYLERIFDRDGKFTEAGKLMFICKLLMWIVGILGNFVNLVVFGHKNMAHRPINLIFWWLSMSDILELAILALYEWSKNWLASMSIFSVTKCNGYDNCMFIIMCGYLFQVIHTITVGLTILLAFYQYMAVARPLTNQKNSLNHRSIRLVVIWMYISSFVLYLPLWYVHVIQYDESSRRGTVFIRHSKGSSKYFKYEGLVNICILVYGIVLRIGLLIILIILCILFLYAIRNAFLNRQNLGMQAHHLSKAQRNLNRINVTVVVVIIMFSITEVPTAISSIFILFRGLEPCSYAINRFILFFSTLLNCCYSIFCYLFRIKKYRETLKLLLSKSNWVSSRARVIEQTDLELLPL